ncbi:DUF2273 domain-containing protein [Liquorilactobacillus oeni]|uniref:Small integral membrane protein n=1 Tax=Liquorilactobacillus oeni DSM 19972 TaxID=1423777 RepID=A0A0R1MAL9_9LACO|nr:DUF2273 domain-containing protein [Liquorilactobacillus oeni]KRL05166.1 hypothetical protein FD46_GL001117 [Liquorilactobacillus oeni DSM 19972]
MQEFWEEFKLPIIIGLAGFILALLFITLGFFKTLLILVLTVVGVLLGFYLKRSGTLERFFK